jgi:hypothetical protein
MPIGLTRDAVKTKTELRLRSVGLKPVDASATSHFLYVHVYVTGGAFSIQVEFDRKVSWTLPNGEKVFGFAGVWNQPGAGTHGGSSTYVLNNLDQTLDTFLNAYLKVNQDDK